MEESDLLSMTGDELSQAVAPRNGTAVATQGADPFAAHGRNAKKQGQYLSFTTLGKWVYGQEKRALPHGTLLVAFMPGYRTGWKRWFGGKADDYTELLTEGRELQKRSELGDEDKELWETIKRQDGTEEPRDPWQYVEYVEFADSKGQVYFYSTSAKTGINEMRSLCARYSEGRRQRPDMLPVVELGARSYISRDYGERMAPILNIVGWTDADNPSIGDAEGVGEIALNRPGQRAANPTIPSRAGPPSMTTTSRFKTHF